MSTMRTQPRRIGRKATAAVQSVLTPIAAPGNELGGWAFKQRTRMLHAKRFTLCDHRAGRDGRLRGCLDDLGDIREQWWPDGQPGAGGDHDGSRVAAPEGQRR